ncbi:MAG: hypothetical protein A3E60_02025 [Candidatus Kerfeldbacteria bacterium RIFCSPHIGHO2_12_FULL_42_13]|nr:MAG: hypothetical protein A3E60_02025 [Candidatus Kerfeldbacteria bacterium RIFCSPHIGHO2_12_FULL_42_13]
MVFGDRPNREILSFDINEPSRKKLMLYSQLQNAYFLHLWQKIVLYRIHFKQIVPRGTLQE